VTPDQGGQENWSQGEAWQVFGVFKREVSEMENAKTGRGLTDNGSKHWRAPCLETCTRRSEEGRGRRAGNSTSPAAYPTFCITGASKELLEQEVKPLVEQFLSERGLQLSSEKTVITHIEQGFDFLGQTVRKYQKGKEAKFFITPSKKNVKAFLAKIRGHIKKSRNLTAGELIAELNPQIRGWALYHRHAVSKDVFHAVDHEIFKALWVWAQRRHHHKTRWWIKEKYWPSTGPKR
jgi:Group II intron, maturase-specific domain